MTATRIALLYPGDRAARDRSNGAESRFADLFDAMRSAGVHAETAIYHDDFADEVEAQLGRVDGVLVWYNPIEGGRRRERLDALLRKVAARGVLVSAHPDTILRLGTKDVLFDIRNTPFGSDVHRIDSLAQLADELPSRLLSGPRVLKQHRGQSGTGVWRIGRVRDDANRFHVQHAQRGSTEVILSLTTLLKRMSPYFEEHGGHMIDQAWQPRLTEGMTRAYLVRDRVEGFGHQAINALYPAASNAPAPQPGPRLYHGPDAAAFQNLKHLLEDGWIDLICERTGVPHDQLPVLWDCDFLFGERAAHEPERYVLCEINVSSVHPFPSSCMTPIVAAVSRWARRDQCL